MKSHSWKKKISFNSSGNSRGTFTLSGKEYRSLDDKIIFLLTRIGKEEPTSKGSTLWQNFVEFKKCRDRLVHPKPSYSVVLTYDVACEYYDTAKEMIVYVAKAIWNQDIKI